MLLVLCRPSASRMMWTISWLIWSVFPTKGWPKTHLAVFFYHLFMFLFMFILMSLQPRVKIRGFFTGVRTLFGRWGSLIYRWKVFLYWGLVWSPKWDPKELRPFFWLIVSHGKHLKLNSYGDNILQSSKSQAQNLFVGDYCLSLGVYVSTVASELKWKTWSHVYTGWPN